MSMMPNKIEITDVDIKIEIIKLHLKALESDIDDLFNSVKNLIKK